MNRLLLPLATAATIGVLWLAGEQHRSNCLQGGRESCSVLPWDAGHPQPQRPISPAVQRQLDEAARRGR